MEIAAGSNVNVLKIVVYHEDDLGNVTLIPLTKKNVCKNLTQIDCGTAVMVQKADSRSSGSPSRPPGTARVTSRSHAE